MSGWKFYSPKLSCNGTFTMINIASIRCCFHWIPGNQRYGVRILFSLARLRFLMYMRFFVFYFSFLVCMSVLFLFCFFRVFFSMCMVFACVLVKHVCIAVTSIKLLNLESDGFKHYRGHLITLLFCALNDTGIILYMGATRDRRRFNVTSSLIGWSHTQNDSRRCKHDWYIPNKGIHKRSIVFEDVLYTSHYVSE